MRKHLLLSLVLTFVACSGIEGANRRADVSPDCVAAPPPWFDLELAPTAETAALGTDPVLRAVTLNIHSGMGSWKGLWSRRAIVQRRLDEFAAAIVATDAQPIDIVALNEVDFSARRSGGLDQAQHLAAALQQRTGVHYQVVYGKTRTRLLPGFDGSYGNAVLVRHALIESRACLFDDLGACGLADAPAGMPALRAGGLLPRLLRERRGLIKLTLDFHGRALDVIVTHLEAVALSEREAQASHLLRRFVDPARSTIVLGDVNAVPATMTHTRPFAIGDRTHDILTSGNLADARVLVDARRARADFRAWATYPAVAPLWPLDTAFASLDLIPREARVLDALDTDHRGFYVAYRIARDAAQLRAQHARHDAIRQRRLAQILACDSAGSRIATLDWLRHGTQFPGLPAEAPPIVPRATAAAL
jgi:endonuclease/exonuclease/phosphatase family metal-dependent hydrolase